MAARPIPERPGVIIRATHVGGQKACQVESASLSGKREAIGHKRLDRGPHRARHLRRGAVARTEIPKLHQFTPERLQLLD